MIDDFLCLHVYHRLRASEQHSIAELLDVLPVSKYQAMGFPISSAALCRNGLPRARRRYCKLVNMDAHTRKTLASSQPFCYPDMLWNQP